jgi:hypothetical protein
VVVVISSILVSEPCLEGFQHKKSFSIDVLDSAAIEAPPDSGKVVFDSLLLLRNS